jgi:hypothetical protein
MTEKLRRIELLYGKEPVHFVHILGRLAYLCFEARDLNTAISHTVRKLKILTNVKFYFFKGGSIRMRTRLSIRML